MPGTIRSLRCCLPLRKRSSWGHRRAAHWGHCLPCLCARWWTPPRQAARHCRLQLQTKSVDIFSKIGGYFQIFFNGGYFQILSAKLVDIFQWWIFSDIFQWWIFSDISANLVDIISKIGGYFQIYQQNWWIFSDLFQWWIFSDISAKLVDIFKIGGYFSNCG